VRELRNIVERVVIMTPRDLIEASDLPASLLASLPAPVSAGGAPREGTPEYPSLQAARDAFEKGYIWKKYQDCGGNMSKTADALQVERSNLYRKMKGFGLIPARKGESEPA
jgi:two-component system nitrogen regulation response regulator NtrX